MKNLFFKIFIWISGVDNVLLKDCPESEHKKYALQGGLVMIPTTMAFVSMLYASTLLTTNFYFQLSYATLWTLIIFTIDRYLVATFVKKENGGDYKSTQFIIRIIFSALLGIVISHPVTIRIFEDKIAETQTSSWIAIKDSTENKILKEYQQINDPINSSINRLKANIDSFNMASSFERNGVPKVIAGYITSPEVGIGPKTKRFDTLAINATKEKDSLIKVVQRNDSVAKTKTSAQISEIEKTLGKGYWAKDDALTLYLDKNKKWIKYYLILIFLIFIDITAILLKVFTKYGEYDEKLELRSANRIQQKKYFLTKLLAQNNFAVDIHNRWAMNTIKEIYERLKNATKEEMQVELDKHGVLFIEPDITDIKPKLKLPAILQDVWALRKETLFQVLSIVSVVVSIIITYLFFQKNNQTSSSDVSVISFFIQVIINVIAGVITFFVTNLKKANSEH